ncbi:uncharacterized protein LOC144444583 isoform X2 [Glandiceps talaboti]
MLRKVLLLSLYLPAVFGTLLKEASLSQVKEENLETLLRHHFHMSRRHDVNITAKYVVRDFVRDTFEDYGLEVVMHNFPTRKAEFNGTNVIGILNGKQSNTPNDRLVLLGAHYDTADATPGVDDNGSGMALLLETARVVSSRCQPDYTILFVAFDYTEYTISWAGDPCYWDVPCGSQRFVDDWLITFMAERNYPQFQGALIADTLMNWDSSENSQALPGGFNILFGDPYNSIQTNDFRGDFLFLYSRPRDNILTDTFTWSYNDQSNSSFRLESVVVPITGQPTTNDKRLYRAQLRSDHHNFWRSSSDFNAIQLTDSANFRGDMQLCHHRMCDNVGIISQVKISFLTKISKAVVDTLLNLSSSGDDCYDEGDVFDETTESFPFHSTISDPTTVKPEETRTTRKHTPIVPVGNSDPSKISCGRGATTNISIKCITIVIILNNLILKIFNDVR